MFNLLPSWFGLGRNNKRRKQHVQPAPYGGLRRLHHEQLEDRRMLATLMVSVNNDGAISNNDGDLTLREAIAYSMGTAAPLGDDVHIDDTVDNLGTNDIIKFDSDLDGDTILLTQGALPQIDESLSINASMLSGGLTIDAGDGTDNMPGTGDGFRVLDLYLGYVSSHSSKNVTLDNLTITGGDVTGDGGGIKFYGYPYQADGVNYVESLTITNSSITGNDAGQDGGMATYFLAA